MKYINADLIKELMKQSIALQGNCEYALWLQTVDNYVENLPSIDIDSRGHETMSDKVWCSKCRYLYRDFKYGLSCYRLMDNEPCKYEERKDEPTSSKMEQVDVPQKELVRVKYHCINCAENGSYKCSKCDGEMYYKYDKDEPQLTPNYCGTCKHREVSCGDLPCDVCHGYSNYEPKDEPQTCSFSDCDNFKNPDYERCIECKRKQIKLKTERMERSSE